MIRVWDALWIIWVLWVWEYWVFSVTENKKDWKANEDTKGRVESHWEKHFGYGWVTIFPKKKKKELLSMQYIKPVYLNCTIKEPILEILTSLCILFPWTSFSLY